MKKILFVDDETNVLRGLQRMLYPMRREWDMHFAGSGQEALRIFEESHQDILVVISDMRMPGMDGAQLLSEVMKNYPQTVRIILSGQSDEEAILRCIGKTHQFLLKPCNTEELISVISRVCALQQLINNNTLKQLISQLESLPSAPSIYTELIDIIKKPDIEITQVAEVISRDAGMSAKVLQLVNSSFFGTRYRVSNPLNASIILGLKTIRSLIATGTVFTDYCINKTIPIDVEEMANHNTAVSIVSRTIAEVESSDLTIVDDATTAGLLHDIGKIVLATNLPEQYSECIDLMHKEQIPVWVAEKEVFNATHADVGAYLLGIRGLPEAVVNAVGLHHDKTTQEHTKSIVQRSVYFAEILCHELDLRNTAIDSTKIAEAYQLKRTQMGI